MKLRALANEWRRARRRRAGRACIISSRRDDC